MTGRMQRPSGITLNANDLSHERLRARLQILGGNASTSLIRAVQRMLLGQGQSRLMVMHAGSGCVECLAGSGDQVVRGELHGPNEQRLSTEQCEILEALGWSFQAADLAQNPYYSRAWPAMSGADLGAIAEDMLVALALVHGWDPAADVTIELRR